MKTKILYSVMHVFFCVALIESLFIGANAQTTLPGRQLGTVTTNKGKTIYLAGCLKNSINSVVAYVKVNGKYLPEKVFKVGKGFQSEIKSVKYDTWKSSSPDNGYFAFNAADKTLYLPLIEKDEEVDFYEGYDRYIVYKFDGEHFFFKGKDGGFWLHPSIRTFSKLISVGKTKGHLIRIDEMKNGTYRYTAWKNKSNLKDMAGKPDLILNNGKETDGPKGWAYYFTNSGYTYAVDFDVNLTVFHGDKIILQQEITEITN